MSRIPFLHVHEDNTQIQTRKLPVQQSGPDLEAQAAGPRFPAREREAAPQDRRRRPDRRRPRRPGLGQAPPDAARGLVPKGRLAEDGVIDREYRLQETPSASYAERTEWNIRDADGTVIFSVRATLAGGTLLAANVARRLKKPLLRLCRNSDTTDAAKRLKAFVARHQIEVLNVAGPRATEEPQISRFVEQTLEQAFGEPQA